MCRREREREWLFPRHRMPSAVLGCRACSSTPSDAQIAIQECKRLSIEPKFIIEVETPCTKGLRCGGAVHHRSGSRDGVEAETIQRLAVSLECLPLIAELL